MASEETVDLVITHGDCVKILQHIFGCKIELKEFSLMKFRNQMGYLGEYYRLSITYHDKMVPMKSKNIGFFVKTEPKNNINQTKFVKEMGVFKKEVLVYENLINQFLKLSSKPFAPAAFPTEAKKCLVLEDLSLTGYKTSKTNYLNFEKSISVMKTMARFHAATLIYEELQSKKIGKTYRLNDYFKDELAESTFSFTEGHPRQKWLVSTTKCVVNLIILVIEEGTNTNISKTLNSGIIGKKFFDIIFTKMQKFLEPSEKFRNVCTHDDLWCNNIMFNDEGDSVLVDFQLTRYSPPSFDVLLYLLLNLERKLYNTYKDTLLQVYHNAINEELQLHKLSVEQIFPKSEFHRSIESYYLPALIEAVMYGTNVYIEGQLQQTILSDVEVFNDFMTANRSKYIIAEYKRNEMYKKRLNQVLIPLVDYLIMSCL